MRLRKRLALRRAGLKPIHHYAPDLHLASVDYILPVSSKRRLEKAKRDIDTFLENANPDEFNGSFFDSITEREEETIAQSIYEQLVKHSAVNNAIAISHQSELIRLNRAIGQIEDILEQLDSEIDELQKLYDKCN